MNHGENCDTTIIILQNNTKLTEISQSKENLLVWNSFLSPNKDYFMPFKRGVKS